MGSRLLYTVQHYDVRHTSALLQHRCKLAFLDPTKCGQIVKWRLDKHGKTNQRSHQAQAEHASGNKRQLSERGTKSTLGNLSSCALLPRKLVHCFQSRLCNYSMITYVVVLRDYFCAVHFEGGVFICSQQAFRLQWIFLA